MTLLCTRKGYVPGWLDGDTSRTCDCLAIRVVRYVDNSRTLPYRLLLRVESYVRLVGYLQVPHLEHHETYGYGYLRYVPVNVRYCSTRARTCPHIHRVLCCRLRYDSSAKAAVDPHVRMPPPLPGAYDACGRSRHREPCGVWDASLQTRLSCPFLVDSYSLDDAGLSPTTVFVFVAAASPTLAVPAHLAFSAWHPTIDPYPPSQYLSISTLHSDSHAKRCQERREAYLSNNRIWTA